MIAHRSELYVESESVEARGQTSENSEIEHAGLSWAASLSTLTENALCKGKQELFFAPSGERRTKRTKREAIARAYCTNCEALLACRGWARTNREHGFWGGESDEDRARIGFPPRSPGRRAIAELGRTAERNADLAS